MWPAAHALELAGHSGCCDGVEVRPKSRQVGAHGRGKELSGF